MKRIERAQRDITSACTAVDSFSEHLSELQKEIETLRAQLKEAHESTTVLVVENRDLKRQLARPIPKQQKPIVFKDSALKADLKTLKRVEAEHITPKPLKASLIDRILWALYHFGDLTRQQVYYFAGVSATSGPACTAYADIVEDGLAMRVSRGTLHLLEPGKQYVDQLMNDGMAPPPGSYETFEKFVKLEGGSVEKLLRAHYKGKQTGLTRKEWAELAGVSETSGPSCSAFARLQKLDIIGGRGTYAFSLWYLRAIQPTVRVFDASSNTTRRHDVLEGKVVG